MQDQFRTREQAEDTETESETGGETGGDCSDVCSVASSELEMEEELALPDPATADLAAVPLGSLDYEHLMNYFESLKESAA